MSRELNGLKPERVWHYFEEISHIPRCSKKEKKISDYIYNWALSNNLKAHQDEALNVIIYKQGTEGYENSPTIILQGHMDMVCEKNNNKIHDFDNDPLKLIIEGDYVLADKTTLGADNGIAVAYIMALLESNDIPHPPIEALITSDEETGMTGVINLDGALFNGRLLINMDSEGEGIFTAGCAGGMRISFKRALKKEKSKFLKTFKLTVNTLKGGHSGVDIHLDRGNSNKILGIVLNNLKEFIELCYVEGGSAENAIPRESYAVIKTDESDLIEEMIKGLNHKFKNEFKFSDPTVNICLEEIQEDYEDVISAELVESFIDLINLTPYGPLKTNHELDLVIFSNNPGVVKIKNDYITISCAVRSSIMSLMNDFYDQMKIIAKLTKFEIEKGNTYPGWEYAKESYIRDLCASTYKDMTEENPQVIAIHAGLECGFLIERIPGLDAVSLGPNMYDVHTPDERLSISSTEKTYELLKEILKRIK